MKMDYEQGGHQTDCICKLVYIGKVEGYNNLKSYITQFYKRLFAEVEGENLFMLDENWAAGIKQVTNSENEYLTAPFSEKEIREAVFGLEHKKVTGPDGFPAEIYKKILGFDEGRLHVDVP
jgi:hypothetical protein